MKRIAIYPGSFNPFHKGHLNVLRQAMPLFQEVWVVYPLDDKLHDLSLLTQFKEANHGTLWCNAILDVFTGSLADYAKESGATAIIRGLRNSADMEYEKSMLYWNQDLGLTIPTIYFITDRELVHISSSAIRTVKGLK